MVASQEPERWIVYMGKFASPEAQTKKRGELEAMKIKTLPLHNAELEPGISLAGFDNRAAALAELSRLGALGIRTARVLQEQPGGASYRLKLPAVTDAIKLRLPDVKAALSGKPLKSCL
jgi:hypothetical protein